MIGNVQTTSNSTNQVKPVKLVKPVKRSYDEKMKRKYEHIKSKRVHDLLLKVGRKTKNWTLEIDV